MICLWGLVGRRFNVFFSSSSFFDAANATRERYDTQINILFLFVIGRFFLASPSFFHALFSS